MQKFFLVLTCFILLCSMSECKKNEAYGSGIAIEFTLQDPDTGISGLYCAGPEDFTESRINGNTLSLDSYVRCENESALKQCSGISLEITGSDPLSEGQTFTCGGTGNSFGILIRYTDDNGSVHSAEPESGDLKIIIMHGNYAAGIFNADFRIPVYGHDGEQTGSGLIKMKNGFFSVYFKSL